MYAHGLATIALCEAYGLSKDPKLRGPAQNAVNYLLRAQHAAGGWRYGPGQPGDTSVTGWQSMALLSGKWAKLDVPEASLASVQNYLDGCVAGDEGYGYVGPSSTPNMSAVGLLCRQNLQKWDPQNERLIKGVENHIKPRDPNVKDMYYTYYATQVMHHFGGKAWQDWNRKMLESLLKDQDTSVTRMAGSWSSAGAGQAAAGGRIMQTSLCLMTLEVYYRHLPLSYRDGDEKR